MNARGTGETTTAERQAAGAEPGRGPLWRLLNGQTNIDFVGRSRLWLWVVVLTAAVCAGGVALRGLNFNLDFTGGTAFTVSGATREFSSAQIADALAALGLGDTVVQVVDGGQGALVSTPALDEIGGQQQREVVERLAEITGAPVDGIDVSAVGPR